MNTPIVLLGRHGCGKDTMATLLECAYDKVTNIKFGEFGKRLATSAIDVPAHYADNRKARAEISATQSFGFTSDFTLIDLINVLYHGGSCDTPASRRLVNAGINFAMKKAMSSNHVIFTDVRRHQELSAIAEHFPLVTYIWIDQTDKPLTDVEEGDEELESILNSIDYNILTREPQDAIIDTYNTLLTLIDWN